MQPLSPQQCSFLIDLMDCTIEQRPKDILKYEKWNSVDSVPIHEWIWEMYRSHDK